MNLECCVTWEHTGPVKLGHDTMCCGWWLYLQVKLESGCMVVKKFNSPREIKVFLTFEFAQVNMDHLMVFYSAVLNWPSVTLKVAALQNVWLGCSFLTCLFGAPKPFLFMFLTVGSMLIYNVMFSDYACIWIIILFVLFYSLLIKHVSVWW